MLALMPCSTASFVSVSEVSFLSDALRGNRTGGGSSRQRPRHGSWEGTILSYCVAMVGYLGAGVRFEVSEEQNSGQYRRKVAVGVVESEK